MAANDSSSGDMTTSPLPLPLPLPLSDANVIAEVLIWP
jgi:hypothetical protein